MSSPDAQAGWHLKKEIQLGHIITTLTVALSAVIYTQKLEQRIAIMENQMVAQRDRDERQDVTNKEMMNHLRSHLDRMELKIDRLIEYKSAKK